MGAVQTHYIYGIPSELPYTPGFGLSVSVDGYALASGMGGIWHIEKVPRSTIGNLGEHIKLTRAEDSAAANRAFSPITVPHSPFRMRGNNAEICIFT